MVYYKFTWLWIEMRNLEKIIFLCYRLLTKKKWGNRLKDRRVIKQMKGRQKKYVKNKRQTLMMKQELWDLHNCGWKGYMLCMIFSAFSLLYHLWSRFFECVYALQRFLDRYIARQSGFCNPWFLKCSRSNVMISQRVK